MSDFDIEPQVTFKHELTGIPSRRQRVRPYRCDCQQHELSMTRHPALAARGACIFVASDPIAKRAISKDAKLKVSRSFIFNVFSPKLTSVPTDLRLAKASICPIGKLRSETRSYHASREEGRD